MADLDLTWLESWLFDALDFLQLQDNQPYKGEREYRCHPGINVELAPGAPAALFNESRLRFVQLEPRRVKVRFPTRKARAFAHAFIESWAAARLERRAS